MHVSVVIPLYNKAAFVERSVRSALTQTHADFDLIIVDDGSTDRSAQIVSAIGDTRIRLVQQDNAGPGAARNRGIAEAETDLIAFLDADDTWRPEYLERSIQYLQAQPDEVAMVAAGYNVFPGNRPMRSVHEGRGLREGRVRLTPKTSALFAVQSRQTLMHYKLKLNLIHFRDL